MKVKEKIVKMGSAVLGAEIGLMTLANKVFAEEVKIDGNGGRIRSSELGSGVYKIANDVAGTLRWLIPAISVPFILWFLFKMYSGDEQDQARYKKRLITTLAIVAASTLVTVIINLVTGYFG